MNAVRRARRTGDCLSSPPPSEPSAATACGARTRRTLPRAAGLLLAFVALLAAPMAAQAQTTNICGRTQQVWFAILAELDETNCGSVSVADLATVTSMSLSTGITSLRSGDFSGLTALTVLDLSNNQLGNLPEDIFSDLTGLRDLYLDNNQLSNLPAGVFSGLTTLATLILNNNAVNPMPIEVSLERRGGSGFRAVAPTGAPFELVLPVMVENGTIVGGATTVTIPAGDVRSAAVTVARTSGTTDAVTADIGTLPGLPTYHRGYVLKKRAADLPLVVPEPPQIINICNRTPHVRDFILLGLGADDCANILDTDLARAKVIDTSGPNLALDSLKSGDFSGLTGVRSLKIGLSQLSTLPYGIFADLPALIDIQMRYSGLRRLPDGMFAGLHNELTKLDLRDQVVNPLPLPLSLEKVGESGFKAVARTGAPFGMSVPVTVENGTIESGATTVRIPVGAVESAVATVVRTPGTLGAVTADIGTLPGLPGGHQGYALQRADALPLEVLPTNNHAPVFTSAEFFAVDENETTVGMVVATDEDASDEVSYAITGGADMDQFQIDATTDVLSFTTAPNYEAPADADLNNEYIVTVTATSGTGVRELMAVQTITVTVNNDSVELCERTEQVRDAILAKLGETNCGNVGSEELATVSGTINLVNKQITSLKSDDFYGLTALTALWLNNNQLESLPEGIFSGLTALTQLTLYNNQLESLPAGIFSDLTALRSSLQLQNNQLESLPAGIFSGLTALTGISLHNNQLESLPAGIFSGLTALTGISLYNNQLNSLPAGIFFGLTALTTLTLRGNTVDPTIEVSLEKVGESGFRAVALTGAPFAMNVPVTVENGTIESGATTVRIPVGAVESAVVTVVRTPGTLGAVTADIGTLPGLPSGHDGYVLQKSALPLEVLPAIGICERTEQVRDATLAKLGETDCGNVFEAELASITGLLSLSRQGITSLKSDDLYGLTGLTQLDLGDNNQLNSLPEGIFSGLTALALLQISHNQLESLPEGIFSGLTALTSLQISNNQLESLPAGIFSGLTALRTLDLSRNQLESLPEGIFSGLTALRNLNLSGNRVNPLPIPVSLEKVGDSGFKAVAPTGAPFEMVLPITVTNGAIEGDATTVTISLGDVESAAVTVARKSGTSGAVTADIGTLPTLASGHHGYVLQKSALPLEILPAEGNVPPEFTGFVSFEVGENQTTVTTVEAIDPDGDAVSYAITGGADQERFQIGPTSGVLSFTTAPDFENPADADGDNQYVVIVTATGGTGDRALMVDRTIYVTVNDAAEDFCGRTQQVRDAILAKLGETNCGRVGSEELATVSGILDLSNQEITSLRFGDFSGLTALQQLDLKGNVYLNSLPDGVFSGLTALETLDLSETGLSSLPAGVFSGLSALETLDLAYNAGLSSLPVGVFSGLDALETLDLNDTGLSSLPAGVFSGLDALQRLDLTNNTGLSSLPVGVFSSLTALTDLNLSYNPLNSLNSDLFFSLTALTDLNLSHTDLSSLPAGIFSGLTALQRLDLRGNRVDPLPIVVSLEKVGDSGFKAIAPTGAPFTLVLPVTVTNGTIERGATTVTIAAGDVESAAVTVARTSGTTEAVTADIGTLPRLPDGHQGYTLRKAGGLPLEVEAANVAPEFKSAASFSVEENETIVGTVAATDADAGDEVSYAITGGVDMAQFQIDPMSGVLSFRTAPDHENPADVASTDPANEADNNEYIVTVSAISGTGDRTLTVMQTITVTVQDVVGGFCERTPQVRDAILAALTGVDNCGNVGTDELATVTDFPDLSGEGITSLQSGDFSGLTALTGLGLHDNQLSSLPHGIFADLTALEGLSLFNNPQLSSLPAGVFSGLSALRVLYLNDTGLSSLQSGIFAGLNALTELRLSNTGLSSLPDGVFSGLDALVELNLSNTQLSSLPSGVFAGLTALETLLLDNNPQLSSLPSGVFAGLTALTQLNLNSNQLSSLPDGIFAGLTALTQLDLGSNAVDPLPMPVSLEKVGDSGFKAVAPTGAPFALVLPVTVANGAIEGGGDDGDDSARGRAECIRYRHPHQRDDRGRHRRHRHACGAARQPRRLCPAKSRRPAAGGAGGAAGGVDRGGCRGGGRRRPGAVHADAVQGGTGGRPDGVGIGNRGGFGARHAGRLHRGGDRGVWRGRDAAGAERGYGGRRGV